MQALDLLCIDLQVGERANHLRGRHSVASLTGATGLGSQPFEAPLGSVQPLLRTTFVLFPTRVDHFVPRPHHGRPDQSLLPETRRQVTLRCPVGRLLCLPHSPDDRPPSPCNQFQRVHAYAKPPRTGTVRCPAKQVLCVKRESGGGTFFARQINR